jgi:hypothetical protein
MAILHPISLVTIPHFLKYPSIRSVTKYKLVVAARVAQGAPFLRLAIRDAAVPFTTAATRVGRSERTRTGHAPPDRRSIRHCIRWPDNSIYAG